MKFTMSTIDEKHWLTIRTLLQNNELAKLETHIGALSPEDLIRSVFRLSDDEQKTLLTVLSPSSAADLIDELPESQVVEILDDMPAEDAAQIVESVASDVQADILGSMDRDDAQAILEEMEDSQASVATQLMTYDEDSAGGLMQTELTVFNIRDTIKTVLDALRTRESEYASHYVPYLYVTDRGRLAGVVRLREIVFRDPQTRLGDVMTDALSFSPDESMDAMQDVFDEHALSAIPVLNDTGKLLGIVRRETVTEHASQISEETHLKQSGIVAGDEFRSMNVLTRSRRRLSWLSVNIVLNLIAASVIALYQDTITAVIALAVFLPIVSDMSGCSGNQAVAVSLRELSLGIINPKDVLRVWGKELSVGLVNGVVLGGLIAMAAYLWNGNGWLGAVVGAALALNTMIAVSIGGLVPLILRRMRVDPALASGPILTTITDMCGFALVLGFATLALPLLT